VHRLRTIARRASARAGLARVAGALGVAVALGVLYGPALAGHVRLSSNHWIFADDVRVLIHAQFRDEDPGVFPGDPAVDYFLAGLPEGYALFYRALAPLFGVVALSKGLPYVLLAVTLACVARAAWKLGGGAAAFGALALALGSGYLLARMTGGLPRGFAAPLLAAGTLALVNGRARALALLTVAGAGFYPAVALTLGAALALLVTLPASQRGDASGWSMRKRGGVLAVTAVAAALVLLPSFLRLREWGTPIGPALLHAYPEAGPNGRFDAMDRPPFPALPAAALAPLGAALRGDGAPVWSPLDARACAAWLLPVLGLLGLLGCGWLARSRLEARRFLLLPLAALLCHTAALLVEPRLFLPERYVAYAVPVTALVAVPSTLGALRDARAAWLRASPWVFNLLLVLVIGSRGVAWSGLTVHVPDSEHALFAAVARLPKSAVIAAFPSETSDCIPYLTRRSVFLARETHMPFHTRYTELMRERARALFDAYFTSSADVLRELRDERHVTHLLVNRRDFAARPSYFAPFDRRIARDFAAGKANGFAALELAPALRVFARGDWVLLDLAKL
jgi:hypothetical protein